MDLDWKNPLDEFTIRFLVDRLTTDRENYLKLAREVRSLEDDAGEAFMTRAEECGRIIAQLRRLLEKMASIPPQQRESDPPFPRKPR